MLHVAILLACAVVIYLSCEWFVNAVEWLGVRLKVGPLAVGTLLAAFGTALPESVVTFVAVVFGTGPDQKDIGVGAAMGGPLALATVAYGVTGVMLLLSRRRARAVARPAPGDAAGGGDGTGERDTGGQGGPSVPGTPDGGRGTGGHGAADDGGPGAPDGARSMEDGRGTLVTAAPAAGPAPGGPVASDPAFGDTAKLARDQRWFLVIFAAKVALGLVAFAFKPWLGLVFFAAYAAYFWRELRGGGHHGDGSGLEPLLLQRRREAPAAWAVLVQTVVTLTVIFFASQLFVHQLDVIGPMLGLPAAVTALLLSPVATELPEIMNAVIWVRQGKTPLALANISGAMMIQATVPSGLGILFTPWRFDAALVLSGAVTMTAMVFLLTALARGRLSARLLAAVAAFYGVFAFCLVPVLS